jgi:hypothetical protein
MQTLKKIDVFSFAKIFAVISLVLFVIYAIIFVAFSGIILARISASRASAMFGPVLGLGTGAIAILMIVAGVILGFVAGAIEAWLYNIFAGWIGGIKIDLKNNELKRIEMESTAKMFALGGAVLGFIIGIIVLIALALNPVSSVGIGIGIVALILLTIAVAVVFLIFSLIAVFVYNFIASRFGGVMLYFKGTEIKKVGIVSYARIYTLIAALWGLIEGAFITLSYVGIRAHTAMPGAHVFGALAVITLPIFLGIISFIISGLEAWLYNVVVPKVGGIKVIIK